MLSATLIRNYVYTVCCPDRAIRASKLYTTLFRADTKSHTRRPLIRADTVTDAQTQLYTTLIRANTKSQTRKRNFIQR